MEDYPLTWRREELTNELYILWRIAPAGQEEVATGDQLTMRLEFTIPAECSEELRYGGRYKLCGQNLFMSPGKEARFTETHIASTWVQAAQCACQAAQRYLSDLRAMVQARRDAYHSEGYELLVSHRLLEAK